MKPAMRFSLVALLCIAAVAFANRATEVPLGDNTVSYLNTVYRFEDDTTIFSYTVSTGASGLSHFVISTECAPAGGLAAGQDWVDHTSNPDPFTGKYGFLYPIGIDANTVNQLVTLAFHGDVAYGPTGFVVKSGAHFSVGSGIYGPVCNAAYNPKNPAGCTGTAADANITCDDARASGKGSADSQEVFEGRCPGDYVLHNNYRTLVSSFGGYSECTQQLIVSDTAAPSITGLLPNETHIVLKCGQQAPAIPTGVHAVDNCDANPLLPAPCEETSQGSCPSNSFLLRTWTATDHCGNSKCITQTIAWVDDTAPVLVGVPPNEHHECTANHALPAVPVVTATDDCDCWKNPNQHVTASPKRIAGECDNTYTFAVTYSAEDCCGNSASKTWTYTVVDTTPPTIEYTDPTYTPGLTYECDSLPAVPAVTVTDVCTDSTIVPFHNVTRVDGSCDYSYSLVYFWSATDDCGNTQTKTETVHIRDRIAPQFVLSSLPANVTVECGDIPPLADVKASDNCGLASLTHTETPYPGSCLNEQVIIRVWTATDKCGNSVSYTQEIIVVDTTATKFNNVPTVGPFQCAADVPPLLPAPAGLTWGPDPKGCSNEATLTATETVLPGSCGNKKTIIRTYTLTDCSHNTDSVNITIIVDDNTNPTFSGVPADVTVQCDNVPARQDPTFNDNCDCPVATNCQTINYNEQRINGSCSNSYTLKRTWSAADSCGNPVSATQTITVIQTTKPTISDIPADITVQCDQIPARPAVTGHTNCGTFTITTPADTITPGSCSGQYTLVRHWHIVDECGNFNDYSQTINVIDTTKPTLSGVPADATVSCANVPVPADVCAGDNCDGVTISFNQVRTDQTCDANDVFYTLVRTWTATDACGNTVSQSQTIKVTDTIAPTFPNTPTNLNQDCASVSLPPAPQPSDSCTTFAVTEHHFREDGSCDDSYVLHRNFKATDACGNYAWYNYTITVTDTHAPTLHNTPDDASVTCTLPAPAGVTASDDCDATPTLVGPNDVNTTVKCKFDFTTKRTWTATDNCGNPTSFTQTIVVRDDQKPHWTSADPQDASAECVVPAPPTLTATGFCGDTASVVRDDVRTNGSCVYDFTLTRTWTATDVCNNFDTKTQVITVKDISAPTVTGVPADVTVDCAPPSPAEVCLEDNCDGVTGNFVQTVSDQTCPHSYTLTRTWTATDLCGHSTSKSQVITVRDITKPQFTTANPGDQTATCFNGPINAPSATDNCGDAPTITNHTWVEPGDCPYHYKVHVAFKATDSCSNFDWFNYTITVGDSSQPTVQWNPAPPKDERFTCDAVPAAPIPIVSDNCGGASVVGPIDTEIARTCRYEYTIERKWTFSDACGNSFDVVVHLTNYDPANPTFDNAPADGPLKCNDPVPSYNVTGTDSCGNPATVTGPTGGAQSGSCSDAYPIVRTWTVTDACQRSSTHTQTLSVYDNEAPTIVAPNVPTTVADACVVSPPGTPTVTDNCDPNPFVSSNQTERDRTCPYRVVAVNHFYAHDRCGNPSSLDQPITYTWNKLPSLFNTPGSTTVECDSVPQPAVVSGADGCGIPKTPVYNQVRTNGSCPNNYILTRTWTVTDDCQVSNSYTQTITVVDTTLPELCGVPAAVTVQCGFVPDPPTVTAKDTCDGVKLEFNEVKIPGSNCCDYKLERTWTATDACGNVRTGKQVITVVDKIPPVIVVPPNIDCAECPFELDNVTIEAHKPALAHGYCGLSNWPATTCYNNVQNQAVVVVDGANLHYGASTFVTWYNGEAHLEIQLLDTNNVPYLLQAVLSNATGKPTGYSPALELNANCYPGQADPSLWSYYPHITGTLVGNGKNYKITDAANPSQVGLGADGRSVTWGATVYLQYENLAGGSTSDATLRLSLIADGQGSCYFNHTELPHFECNDPIPAVLNVTYINGSCPSSYTILREWCATDESGNKACATQTITVCDTTAPIISGVPSQISVSCDAAIPVAPVTTNDACDNPASLNFTDVKTEGSCPGNYDILRTYVSVDACGNVASKPEQIHVYDHTAPVLSVPDTITVQCDAVPAFAPANATDNCGISNLQPVFVDRANTAGPQNCAQSYIKHRDFTATDECGNSVSGSSAIIVRDDNNPTISNVPADVTLECKAPVPASNPTASDPCGGDITSRITSSPNTQNTQCANLYTTTVTYRVQDYCGNSAEPKTWTYTYIDTTNPTWNQAMPANVTVQCDQIPSVPTITAGDSCNSASTVYSTWQVGPAQGACSHNYVIFRKWVATDCAGNSISHTQAITVIDTTNPVITPGTVSDVTATCKAVPNPPDFCVTDNCDGVNAVWTDVRTNSNGQPNTCDQYVRNRTLVATDDCGNTASVSYTVTVNDQTAPTCSHTADYSSECSSFQAPPRPTCTDDCSSASVELFYSTEAGPQNCPQSVIHHYNYKSADDCGNTAWSNTTVTEFDNTKPVLHNVPSGATFECNTPEPADPVTATDNCGVATVHVSDVRTPEPRVCQGVYTLTRTWYASDQCGNNSPSQSATYIFHDTTKPQFNLPMPANTTVQCDQVPDAPTVSGTDNCDTNPQITLNAWNVSGSCDGSYTLFRKWTITDCSGNFDTWTQAITVIDTTFPTLTQAPASSQEVCHQVPAPPAICASDNCDGVNLDYTQVRSNLPGALATCQDQFVLNRTWVATDSCGNAVSTSYTITVNDVTPPTCAPSSITDKSYSCENRAGTAPSRPDCTDGCSTVHYESFPVHVPGSCAYNYIDYFNFKATDDCGNAAWVNTSVTIYDTTSPHFITTPADVTVECDSIPPRQDPTWGDNCGSVSLKSYTELPAVAPTGCKNYVITRTWVIVDECSNEESYTQTITVQDTQKPQWVLPLPTDKTFQCDETWPEPTLSATDNCGTPNTVRSVQTVPGSCNNQYDKVYTWVTTDACGNNDTYSVTYHIIDTSKPTFNTIPAATVAATCDNVPKPDDVCCSDSCDGVKLDFIQTRTDNGCSSQYSLNRTWICTDNCGNVATTTQIVTVTDTNKPTFNAIPVPAKSYECVHTDSQVVLTANDTCTGANVNMTETLVPGECAHNYTVVRKWQAMDDCGNQDWVYQNVSVQDTLPPHVDQSNISCYSVNNYLKDVVVVYNLTQEGNVFTTGDACSGTPSPTDALPRPLSHASNYPPSVDAAPTTIEYYSCSSDLDAWFGNGCTYDASSDQLTLEADMDPVNNKTGRMYTIVVKVTDQCGHSVFGTHQILIPFDENSAGLRHLPSDVNCVVAPGHCDENCACQTVDHFCSAGADYGTLSAAGTSVANGNTEFKYNLAASTSSQVPQLVQIAIDLSKYEIVATSPAGAELGYQFGSSLVGISWKNFAAGTTQFSFTVAGTVSAVGPVSYLLGVGLDTNDAKPTNYPTCGDVATVNGPTGPASFAGTNGDISGTVVIAGARFGTLRSLNLPLADVVVGLRNVGSSSFLRLATTDATGSYTFHDVSATGKEVIIVEDGLLRSGGQNQRFRSSKAFLRATVNIIFGQPTYGVAQAASSPNFTLLLDDEATPKYSRQQNNNDFEGNSKPWYYWLHQKDGLGASDFNSAEWSAINSQATASTCTQFSGTTGSLDNQLTGAAYNIAAGFGIFEPYDEVQTWMFAFAQYVRCGGGSASASALDQAIALKFAQRINDADDSDRA